ELRGRIGASCGSLSRRTTNRNDLAQVYLEIALLELTDRRSAPFEDRDLPEELLPVEPTGESSRPDDVLDVGGSMAEETQQASEQPHRPVDQRRAGPDPPCVAWVNKPIATPGMGGGQANEGAHVRVAADDPIEND